MNLIFPDEGLIFLCQRIGGNGPNPTAGNYWALYTNNVDPDRSTTLGILTLDTTNFPVIQLDQTDLTTQGVASDVASISGPVQNFTNGSGSTQSVYGYAVIDPSNTFLVACARFDSAPISIAAGDAMPVLPILQSRSQLP